MVVGAITVFFASLAGIVGLFSLKLWEERSKQAAIQGIREMLDSFALQCKRLLLTGEVLFSRLPSLTTFLAMEALAISAVWFARIARSAAEASHRLAEFVSHKHNFERRETRSDFLKQVSEHQKNGNSNASTAPIATVPTSERTASAQRGRYHKKLIRDIDVHR